MIEAALDKRLTRIEARLSALELGGKPAPEPESRVIWQGGWRPAFWRDVEVRRYMIARHRQTSILELREEMLALFGASRTPSRSAIGRLWKRLDASAKTQRRAA